MKLVSNWGEEFLLSYKGIDAERQLIRLLKDRGYDTQRSAGSRGAIDIMTWKSKWLGLSKKTFGIQVKAANGDELCLPKNYRRFNQNFKKR